VCAYAAVALLERVCLLCGCGTTHAAGAARKPIVSCNAQCVTARVALRTAKAVCRRRDDDNDVKGAAAITDCVCVKLSEQGTCARPFANAMRLIELNIFFVHQDAYLIAQDVQPLIGLQ
jgi:hypothetical protein